MDGSERYSPLDFSVQGSSLVRLVDKPIESGGAQSKIVLGALLAYVHGFHLERTLPLQLSLTSSLLKAVKRI